MENDDVIFDPRTFFTADKLEAITKVPSEYVTLFLEFIKAGDIKLGKSAVRKYAPRYLFEKIHTLETIYLGQVIPYAAKRKYIGINNLVNYYIGFEMLGAMSGALPDDQLTIKAADCCLQNLDDKEIKNIIQKFNRDEKMIPNISLIRIITEYLNRHNNGLKTLLVRKQKLLGTILENMDFVCKSIYLRIFIYRLTEYIDNLPIRSLSERDYKQVFLEYFRIFLYRQPKLPHVIYYHIWNGLSDSQRASCLQPRIPWLGRFFYKYYSDTGVMLLVTHPPK
ncbi:MAG: hypothetical protein WCK35_18990 [Chloroflexota bacterium]